MRNFIATLTGLDPDLAAELSPRDQRRLSRLQHLYLLPPMVMGLSAGLFSWLVERSPLLSVALTAGVALVVINLVRLVVAGGGAAPQLARKAAERWAPTLPPVLILGGLAACFAQPVQLVVFDDALAPQIAEYRAELVERHQKALGAGPESVRLSSPADYGRELSRCYFVTRRLSLLWQIPEGPFLFTLLFAAVTISPLLLSHTRYLDTLRRYELLRWQQTRSQLEAEEARAQAEVHAALAAFPHFAPGPLPRILAASGATRE